MFHLCKIVYFAIEQDYAFGFLYCSTGACFKELPSSIYKDVPPCCILSSLLFLFCFYFLGFGGYISFTSLYYPLFLFSKTSFLSKDLYANIKSLLCSCQINKSTLQSFVYTLYTWNLSNETLLTFIAVSLKNWKQYQLWQLWMVLLNHHHQLLPMWLMFLMIHPL